ncbi:hypothetical protein PsAD2_03764 [Pseudovibrio axinellae]|uniref:Uncharacterized protein n=1 Tax=Pseudovibrio axinellae TaxID=989403 RepID=A0A165VL41_9HYPH|nr:hypothetical protein PsAD2_03764 [Pseudovibrio axinellae]SER89667.1 hypothetical protein SAMN05421798_1541 [Pseudovibrio axinellae]
MVLLPLDLETLKLAVDQDTSKPGAFDLGEGLTPVDVWQGLHASEPLWIASAGVEGGEENQSRINSSDLSLLKKLEAFPAKRWAQMCDGIGWTHLGAIGLSWCQGSTDQAFNTAWSIAVPDKDHTDSQQRALRLVKPS